jgi:hypothetical protein
MKKITIVLVMLLILGAQFFVLQTMGVKGAVDPGNGGGISGGFYFDNPLGNRTLEDIVDALTDLLFKIAVVMVPLFIIYAAFLIVTAGGNPEQASKGRKIIVWASLGFAVVLLARGLFDLVLGLLGV